MRLRTVLAAMVAAGMVTTVVMADDHEEKENEHNYSHSRSHDENRHSHRDHKDYHDRHHGYRHRSCEIDLNANIQVAPEYIRIFDNRNSDGDIEIHSNGDAFVDGKRIELTADQQELTREYAQELGDIVPATVEVVDSALALAGDSIATVFGEMLGDNEKITRKINDAFSDARDDVQDILNKKGNVYTIHAHGFDDFDRVFEDKFEQRIEDIAKESIGSLLMMVGSEMANGDGDFEERIEAFAERMEKMGEEIEDRVERQAERLEEKGEALCRDLERLDKVERRIARKIPELSDLDLIRG